MFQVSYFQISEIFDIFDWYIATQHHLASWGNPQDFFPVLAVSFRRWGLLQARSGDSQEWGWKQPKRQQGDARICIG